LFFDDKTRLLGVGREDNTDVDTGLLAEEEIEATADICVCTLVSSPFFSSCFTSSLSSSSNAANELVRGIEVEGVLEEVRGNRLAAVRMRGVSRLHGTRVHW
jgi:hypothetical protein